MANHHYYMPAGLPPGEGPTGMQEGPPEAVYYYRIYGGTLAVLYALAMITGIGTLLNALLSGGAASGSHSAGDTVVGILVTAFSIAFLIPCLLSLLGGRKGWVHALGTVVIVFSMLTTCCLPIAIPMLIYWTKPETKRWFSPT